MSFLKFELLHIFLFWLTLKISQSFFFILDLLINIRYIIRKIQIDLQSLILSLLMYRINQKIEFIIVFLNVLTKHIIRTRFSYLIKLNNIITTPYKVLNLNELSLHLLKVVSVLFVSKFYLLPYLVRFKVDILIIIVLSLLSRSLNTNKVVSVIPGFHLLNDISVYDVLVSLKSIVYAFYHSCIVYNHLLHICSSDAYGGLFKKLTDYLLSTFL